MDAQDWMGDTGITRIDGSSFHVIGLPVHKICEMLEDFLGTRHK